MMLFGSWCDLFSLWVLFGLRRFIEYENDRICMSNTLSKLCKDTPLGDTSELTPTCIDSSELRLPLRCQHRQMSPEGARLSWLSPPRDCGSAVNQKTLQINPGLRDVRVHPKGRIDLHVIKQKDTQSTHMQAHNCWPEESPTYFPCNWPCNKDCAAVIWKVRTVMCVNSCLCRCVWHTCSQEVLYFGAHCLQHLTKILKAMS